MYRTRELVDGAQAACPGKFEIAACYDIDRSKTDYAAQKYGGKAFYAEEQFLAQDMDVVIISLPPYLHPEAFAHVAAAGKDVYLEKPVCVDAGGRELLLNTIKTHPSVKCYTGLSYRYIGPFRKVKEILSRPDSGKILGVHHHWLVPGDLGLKQDIDSTKLNWRHRFEQSGGQLVCHCCHILDWLRWIGGDMESVMANSFTPPGTAFPFEECELTACFNYRQGGQAVFNLSQNSHQYDQFGLVHTENLGISYAWGNSIHVRVYRTRSRAADEIYEWPLSAAYGEKTDMDRSALQMRDFIEAYLNKGNMPCTLMDGITSYDMACAIRESYRSGRRVSILNT